MKAHQEIDELEKVPGSPLSLVSESHHYHSSSLSLRHRPNTPLLFSPREFVKGLSSNPSPGLPSYSNTSPVLPTIIHHRTNNPSHYDLNETEHQFLSTKTSSLGPGVLDHFSRFRRPLDHHSPITLTNLLRRVKRVTSSHKSPELQANTPVLDIWPPPHLRSLPTAPSSKPSAKSYTPPSPLYAREAQPSVRLPKPTSLTPSPRPVHEIHAEEVETVGLQMLSFQLTAQRIGRHRTRLAHSPSRPASHHDAQTASPTLPAPPPPLPLRVCSERPFGATLRKSPSMPVLQSEHVPSLRFPTLEHLSLDPCPEADHQADDDDDDDDDDETCSFCTVSTHSEIDALEFKLPRWPGSSHSSTSHSSSSSSPTSFEIMHHPLQR